MTHCAPVCHLFPLCQRYVDVYTDTSPTPTRNLHLSASALFTGNNMKGGHHLIWLHAVTLLALNTEAAVRPVLNPPAMMGT